MHIPQSIDQNIEDATLIQSKLEAQIDDLLKEVPLGNREHYFNIVEALRVIGCQKASMIWFKSRLEALDRPAQ